MSQTQPAAGAPGSPDPESAHPDEHLSAWMDGDASAMGTQDLDLVAAWRRDPGTRSRWSEYHGIGDVLRSDELAGPGDDARFLAGFRARLAAEPVVLAPPADLPAGRQVSHPWTRLSPTTWRWVIPVGMAAGLAAVSSAVWILQPAAQDVAAAQLAQETQKARGPAPDVVLSLGERQPAPSGLRPNGPVDPLQTVEFEPYFSAHKQFQPATATGTASGFLRSAVYETR